MNAQMLTKQSTLILPGPASLRAGNHSNSGKDEETIEQTGQLGCLENNFIKHREKKLWHTNRQEKILHHVFIHYKFMRRGDIFPLNQTAAGPPAGNT